MHQGGATLEGREARAGQLEGVRVAVHPDEACLGTPVEHRLGVPAEAEGGVDEDRAGSLECRRHQGNDPVEQDRDVGGSAHRP